MSTGVYPKIQRKETKILKDSLANIFFKREASVSSAYSTLASEVSVRVTKHVRVISGALINIVLDDPSNLKN